MKDKIVSKVTESELSKVRKLEGNLMQMNETLGRLSSDFEFKKSMILKDISETLSRKDEFLKELAEIYGDGFSLDISNGELSNQEKKEE